MITRHTRDQAEGLRLLAASQHANDLIGAGTVALHTDGCPARRERPYILAVTSGKGGVGKTTIASNLAVCLARLGLKTAILDADVGLANVEVLLNCASRRHLGDVLTGSAELREVWVEGPAGVRVISAGSGANWLADLARPQREQLVGFALDIAGDCDILLVDTAPGISADVTDFLAAADGIVVVATPEPTALADTYALVKTIFGLGIAVKWELIVNSAQDCQSARRAANSIDSVCRKFLNSPLAEWDWMPTDPHVSVAIARQLPVTELAPSSGASAWLRRKAAHIANRAAARERVAVG